MKKTVLFLAMATALVFASCDGGRHSRRHKHTVVHSYKTVGNITDALLDNDFIFWYIIESNNGCYYASSSSPITNFSSVNWTASASLPKEVTQPGAQKEADQEVETEDLEAEVQTEIENNPEAFEESQTDANESASESDGGSESDGSSDGGSDGGGDSGGGDGGGGDGGGGGGD